MLNKLPILGWFITMIGSASLAVPFWVCWTYMEMGTKYFSFLPPLYQSIPFWDCAMLFLVLDILKGVFLPRFGNHPAIKTEEAKP